VSALHLERLQVPYALVATVAIALVAGGGSSIAGAGARSRPQPPLVTSEGRTERTLLGAYCWGAGSQPYCTAGTGRHSRQILDFRPGGTVIVDTRLKADSVRYALYRGGRLLDRSAAMRRDQSGRSWVIELGPRERIGRARDLDLDVSYAQGRVSSSIRLQRDRHGDR